MLRNVKICAACLGGLAWTLCGCRQTSTERIDYTFQKPVWTDTAYIRAGSESRGKPADHAAVPSSDEPGTADNPANGDGAASARPHYSRVGLFQWIRD